MKTTIRAVVASLIFMTPVMMNAAVSAGTKAPSSGTSSSKEVFTYKACDVNVYSALVDAGTLKAGDNCQVATSQSSGQVQIVLGGMKAQSIIPGQHDGPNVPPMIAGHHNGPSAPPMAVQQSQSFEGQSSQ